MGQPQPPSVDYAVPESASLGPSKYFLDVHGSHNTRGSGFLSLKKRGHNLGNRSWIKIDRIGNSSILELDKFTIMRRCNLPSRDLRLLDPLFIYPSSILGRESAIVVCLEQIRCIITADEVILMNSLDGSVLQYKSELCKRLETSIDQSGKIHYLLKHGYT